MTYPELKRRLQRLGVILHRQGKRHEIWLLPTNGRRTSIPRHADEVPSGLLRSILRDLDIPLETLRRDS